MFRFTIRDVLWLMVVVGFFVGWLCERRAKIEQMALAHERQVAAVKAEILSRYERDYTKHEMSAKQSRIRYLEDVVRELEAKISPEAGITAISN